MEQLYSWADFQEKSHMIAVADNPVPINNALQMQIGPNGAINFVQVSKA